MVQRPPSPDTPVVSPSKPVNAGDESVLVTTQQLVDILERYLGDGLDESTLETILLELDRGGYVEWVTVTQSNGYIWDLSESPEKIGEAIADAAVACLDAWLQDSDN
ncbi:hypothetical protein [Natranaeroarchaeum aerophilus]|uniref:Uncharacterized protein n=1 Tax=Natranaeroarchaeum aerophilus TaxID=2917711 RepID=A0AAE3FT48_9EURY|nr:hypothetical protein [Natranaeroarchaeum aerophilus]MCL9814671.1 hypothetical protein [Natranaeroarchaeum aerophilus]